MAGRRLAARGMPSAHDQPSPERPARGEAVYPTHGIGPVPGGVAQPVDHGGESAHGFGLDDHPSGLDRLETERHLGDETRQAHATDGSQEELALQSGAALDSAAVGCLKRETIHEPPECAGTVMVLAVHVAGDAAAHRDELGPGRHRRKPAAGQEHAERRGQGEPGLAGEHARRGLEGQDAVGANRLEHERAGRCWHGRVTVGAAEPAGKHLARFGQREALRAKDRRLADRMTAPPCDGLDAQPIHRGP